MIRKFEHRSGAQGLVYSDIDYHGSQARNLRGLISEGNLEERTLNGDEPQEMHGEAGAVKNGWPCTNPLILGAWTYPFDDDSLWHCYQSRT